MKASRISRKAGQSKNNIIASVEMSTAQGGHGWVRSVEETKANAQLIAAAPELLEALKALLESEWQDDEGHPRLEKARASALAAINKAEGKA